jgi:hypothetical protein
VLECIISCHALLLVVLLLLIMPLTILLYILLHLLLQAFPLFAILLQVLLLLSFYPWQCANHPLLLLPLLHMCIKSCHHTCHL